MNYLQIVSEVTGVKPGIIKSKLRNQTTSEARQICMYFYRKQEGIYNAGKILNRNHGSVFYGANRVEDLLFVKDKRTCSLVAKVIEIANTRKEINF